MRDAHTRVIAYALQLPLQRTSDNLCGFMILQRANTTSQIRLHRQHNAAYWMQLKCTLHAAALLACGISSTWLPQGHTDRKEWGGWGNGHGAQATLPGPGRGSPPCPVSLELRGLGGADQGEG